MTDGTNQLPVHSSLTVTDEETIYQNNDWWKAVVKYHYEGSEDYDEVAVYLWHNDDGWTRKNKYVIKTAEGWQADRTIIQQFISQEFSGSVGSEYPVSDYYGVSTGKTVFRSDGWWKAILKISQKGSYETEEVMVYLWQREDEEWSRRQKYTVKNQDSWLEEKDAIESVLNLQGESKDTTPTPEIDAETDSGVSGEIAELANELESHLSKEYQ